MKKPFALALTALATLTAESAYAKSVGHYSAHVTVLDGSTQEFNDWTSYMRGWSCSSSSTIRFSETLPDHKGRLREVGRNIDQAYSRSFMERPEIHASFDRNMDASNPEVTTLVRENCSKTFYDTVTRCQTVTDSQGRPYKQCKSVREAQVRTVRMNWECAQGFLPESPGQSVSATCYPTENYFGGYTDLETYWLRHMKSKVFVSEVTLNSTSEVFAKDFCDGKTENRTVIQLSQGTDGHFGEDDFVFHVKIGDQESFDIKNRTGILFDEIAYCGTEDRINVSVTATEDDLFKDDQYTPADGDGVLSLSREAPENEGKIRLKRKTRFGKLFMDRDHEIRVRIKR